MEVTGGVLLVLVGELLGAGLEDDGGGVELGVVDVGGAEETGEELEGAEDCGDDDALDVNSKVSRNAHISQNLTTHDVTGVDPEDGGGADDDEGDDEGVTGGEDGVGVGVEVGVGVGVGVGDCTGED